MESRSEEQEGRWGWAGDELGRKPFEGVSKSERNVTDVDEYDVAIQVHVAGGSGGVRK